MATLTRPPRVAIVGAGVSGAIATRGLLDLGIEAICLERAAAGAHDEAGTGLNVGPNAMTALRLHRPDLAQRLREASRPWRRWTVALTDGTPLLDLDLADVADDPGIRIRWADLYALLREGLPIRHGVEVRGIERGADGRARLAVASGGAEDAIEDLDLVVAADGRYSRLRAALAGPPAPRHLGVAMYRMIWPAGPDCPIDDYGQWFNGPNRLLAFTVPGGRAAPGGAFVYCAGSFPIDPDRPVPEAMKAPDALARLYLPAGASASREAAYLVDGIAAGAADIHWARVQEDRAAFAVPGWPVVLVGDAAHPMIPTLGQGATQSIEDAVALIDVVAGVLAEGDPFGAVPALVEARRLARVRFVMDFSREASDTILAGADPVAGTRAKGTPDFLARLARLYRGPGGRP